MAEPGNVVRCSFCNSETRVPAASQPIFVFSRDGQRRPSLLLLAAPIILLAALGVTLPFIFWRSTPQRSSNLVINMPAANFKLTSQHTELTTQRTEVIRSFQPVKSTIKPSEIPTTLEKDVGWQELDAPGMIGRFETFNANANVPWASAIARNWSNDAELESVYLTGVKPDGTLDLSVRPDHDADYRFASKHLWAAHEKLQEVSEKQLTLEFRVRVSAGKVTFLGSKPLIPRKPELGPMPPAFQCPLATVLETASADGLAPRPFYDLMGRYLAPRKKWAWWVSAKDTHAGHRIAVDASCKRL